MVVSQPGPVSWTLVRCLGASGPVPCDRLTSDSLAGVHAVVVLSPEDDPDRRLTPILGQVRRMGHTGYVLVLDLGLGGDRSCLPADDALVDIVELPASLADVHAKLAAGRGRRPSSAAAAAVRARYDDSELYMFLRNSLGHSSLASIRRTFTQAEHSLAAGDRALADRYFARCGESCRKAIDSLAAVMARLSLKPSVRHELDGMRLALEEAVSLVAQLGSGGGSAEMVSRIAGLIAEVRDAIDRAAPKKEATVDA